MDTSTPEILRRSPLDLAPCTETRNPDGPSTEPQGWVPSHYNVHTVAEDGRLVLWNTYRGSLCTLPAEQASRLRPLLRRPGVEAPRAGAVEYLANRGFLVPEEGDEEARVRMAIGRQRFRTDRLELILLASEDCNFRCKYCYEKFARGTMQPQVRTGIKKLVERNLPKLKSLSVSWFGGEPLYGWEAIEDLGPFFAETAKENGLALNGHITSNGFLLTPEVAGQLLGWGINAFQITVDGPPRCHNASRPARNGDATFGRIFSNLVALAQRDEDFWVNLRVNFDRDNVEELGELVELFSQDFSDDRRFILEFFPVDRWGGESDGELRTCPHEEIEQARQRFKGEAVGKGVRVGTILGRNRLGRNVCYAARPYNFIVGATGKLMKCTIQLDTDSRNVVGRLTEEGELELDDDKLAQWTLPGFERAAKCGKCVFLPLCQGSACPKARIERGKPKCIEERYRWKSSLLEVLSYEGGESRTVNV